MGALLQSIDELVPALSMASMPATAAGLASLGPAPASAAAVSGGGRRPGSCPAWPPDPVKKKARPTAATATGPSFIGDEDGADSASLSTATQAQHERILAALARRPHNTFELRALGVMQVSARVFELRDLGHKILTAARVSARDEDGFDHHGVAVYALLGGVEVRS